MNGHGVREPGVKPSYMNWKSALDDPKTPQSLNLSLVYKASNATWPRLTCLVYSCRMHDFPFGICASAAIVD